jgi:hypothetical protein
MIKTSFEKNFIPLTNESIFKLRWNHNFLFIHEWLMHFQKKGFTTFEKHHTIENTYVHMWFIEQTQEMSQKIQTRWVFGTFLKVRSLSRSHASALK